jgi:RHS repeat-associated protein
MAIFAKEAGGISTVIYEQVFPCSTVINQPIIVDNIPVFANETLKFILSSDSYIDRAALEWTPHFQYIAFTDAMPVIGADGKPSIEEHVAPNNANYNDWLKAANSFSKSAIDTVAIKPYLVPPLTANGTVAFTIKRTTSIIAKRLLQIVNGVITTAIDSIPIDPRGNDTLYIDFHTADRNLALALLKTQFIAFKDSSYIDAFGNTIKVELTDTLEGNLYTEPSEMYLGSLFRGWGHFSFKGAGGNAPLDQMKLNTNGLAGYSIDPELYKDSLLFGNVVDVSGTDFIPLYTDVERMAWVGFDSSVYITGTHLSSARLWLHDVSVDSLMSGGDVMFVNKVTETKSFSQALGLSQILNGTSNVSRSTTTNRLEVLDMNGDGYPDVVSQDDIQYTLPGGGLESIHRTHGLQASIFEGSSKARSLGGGIPTAFAKNFLSITANHVGINVSTAIGLSKSASIGSNNDRVPSTWIDMNGDGLPDKVFSNGDVCINLGYRFSIPEKWGFDDELEKNATADTSAGANLGFSAGFGSKQFGFSLQRSDGKASSLFIDVNADGLPDQLTHSVPISVRLNNGSGFEVLPSWNGAEDIRTTASVGESYNKATTKVTLVPFFLSFLKFCNNPSSYNGIGISSENVQIVDVDGDRYPDIVQSNNDGHLVAKLSTISRTNMLRSVQRPMGSNFSIEYERIGNTVDLPQSKWVLKAFELRDAVPGDGVDTTRTQFNYSGGYYDRHEREFLGFSKVETHEVNTASGNTVYRSTIQEFDNTTFYTRGLLRSQWQQDGSARKFMQTKNTYDVRAVADSVKFPALVKSERFFYEGASSPGITTNTEFDYDDFGNIIEINDAGDGSMQDVLLTNIDYYHVEPLYIHAIPSRIIVRDISRVIVRWRETRINPTTADITQILQYLTNDSVATYDFSYNTFGNLTEVINPENYKAQRLRYTFEFDNQVNTYITKVSDSYGYSSASTYDYRFGEVIGTTSIQNQPMRYSLDNRGRVIRITGPYEIAANKPYTIAFEYNPDSLVPYAVTRHHDPEYNADIVTYTFSDGLGRPIQLKKQAALFKGKNVPDDIQLIVSGRNFYDAFGRIVESFNPTTEVIGPRSRELSSARGQSQATFAYDVLDRPLNSRLADGATTSFTYGISGGFLSVTQKDAYNNVKEILTDVKERTRVMNVHGPNGIITTKYHYNALSELLRVVDAGNNTIAYAYDRIGRQLSMNHPDAGLTTLKYDLAGNVLEKITPQIRHEIPNGGAIKYFYDQERVTDIDYPRQYQNRVKLTYGKPGMGNRTGRLILQQDASGGQEFYYGKLGEITKTIRTVVVSNVFYTTYVSEQEYDTWNRVKKMIYPDGEIVQYFYNRGGTLNRMAGSKAGNNYTYINQIGYDEFGQRVYLLYGNGTESRYTYDEQRRWLKNLTSLTAAGRVFMSNKYKFDLVNNIQEINNDIPLQPNFLGGKSTHTYEYDNLYRLAEAKGRYKSSTDTSYYNLSMTYDNLYNIVSKNMEMPQTRASYNDTFSYAGTGPHQPSRIGAVSYRYDLNGNLLFHGKRKYFWDEENRLMAAIDDGILSQYTYDANGERAVKSTGGLRGTWVNGAPAGIVNHDSSYTAYVSPYLVCRRTSFTKHYYIEGQRIASKIGIGRFKNISFPQPAITAGGIDYLSRIRQIQRDRYAYYNSLGVSPGPPTDKYFYAHPYNRGIASPVIVDSTGSSVPAGWPGNTTPPPMGPPIFVDPIPSNDSVKAGYGFIGTGFFYEQNQFFYHPDHLGSTSYVTNVFGEVSQHTEYAAYGETFVEEHTNSNITPYLFNAKERDAETGLYYYGARYYDPRISIWLSVDPLMDEPEQIEKSPYAYTWNNPIRYTDPDGKFIDIVADVGFILFDIGKLAYDQITTGTTKPEDWKALAADAAGAAIPGVTGLGLAVRASKAVNQTVKASKTAEKLGEASKLVDNASDLHKSDNLSQAGGVYQLKTSLGTYVGQAKDVMKRVTSHFAKGGKLSASELQNAIRHSMPGASKTQREAYEQYLVNKYGLGNLLNIRNPMGGRMDKYKKIIDDVINQFNLPR